MATKTFTLGAGAWKYPDVSGVTHTVTTSQTFTVELTDGGAAAVVYQTDQAQSVTTTDGLRIQIYAHTDQAGASASNGSSRRAWGPTADAQDGVAVYGLAGEFTARCPVSGTPQLWKAISINIDNVDAPTSITAKFEDQFGNSFTWTAVTIS